MKLAFIGLGVMGYPMAGHLQNAGHTVTVYNRTEARATAWVDQYGGSCASTPASACQGAEIAFTCVGNDTDVRSVVLGETGAMQGLAGGSVLVDHTTASAGLAQELAAAAQQRDIGFVDAPVSGGQSGAENGQLTIMIGGNVDQVEQVIPVLDCYARMARRLGDVGSGQLAKMVNQICIAGVVQGLSEGLHFAEAAGLDAADVVQVIAAGAAQSWQMENRYQTMLAGDYEHGFAVDWMRKDLSIVLQQAATLDLKLELTQMVDGFYAQVQDMGGGRWDTSSLLARLKE